MATGTARRFLWGQAWGHRGVRGGLVSRGCRSGQQTAAQQPQDPQAVKHPANHVPCPRRGDSPGGRLRRLRQQTEIWNHEFWAQQNITFSKEKDEYISSQLKARGLALCDEKGRRYTLTSEDMAVFYKSFLDMNRTRHANYNNEWYRRNFTITLLMGRVALTNAWKSITDRLRKSRRSPI
ncbi:hypothetical protein CRUP_023016 [Coryphaenoides rupestris]|nr:hypothetical protein CRUP_023016 [Coryphaenoides rupestris]